MLLYKLFLFSYPKIAKLLGLFNPKAKQWNTGQSEVWNEIEEKIKPLEGHPIIWFHAASFGEFEQGVPIIEAIKIQYPKYKIWVTFFPLPDIYIEKMTLLWMQYLICPLTANKMLPVFLIK
jgi:3-deoxy-D-manno-octulosonic-acid transferase